MNEARVSSGLNILKTSGSLVLLDYKSGPSTFVATVTGTKGPTPGAIAVSVEGTDVDLSQLDTPGRCWMHNMDATNYVEVGIWDPETSKFYPLDEIPPGESYNRLLSRNFGVEYEGTGTGTTPPTNRLRLKANTAPCVVRIDAFER